MWGSRRQMGLRAWPRCRPRCHPPACDWLGTNPPSCPAVLAAFPSIHSLAGSGVSSTPCPTATAGGMEPRPHSCAVGPGAPSRAGPRAPPSPLRRDSHAQPPEPHGSRFSVPPVPLACAGVGGGPTLPHPFTQTFKLASQIAPCNLLAQRHGGAAPRSKSPGKGIRKKQLLPVHAGTRACVLGVPGGRVPR